MPPSATSFVPDCTAFAIEGGKKIVMSSFPDASAAAPPVSVIWTSVNPSSRKYRSAAMIGASHDAHWMRNVVVSGAGSGVGVGAAVTVLAGAALGELSRRSARALCTPQARFAGTREVRLDEKARHAETLVADAGSCYAGYPLRIPRATVCGPLRTRSCAPARSASGRPASYRRSRDGLRRSSLK